MVTVSVPVAAVAVAVPVATVGVALVSVVAVSRSAGVPPSSLSTCSVVPVTLVKSPSAATESFTISLSLVVAVLAA